MESELQYWDSFPNALVTKVTFGHFPMSFTASSEKGERYENIFARHSVSAYICGHLHAKLSKQLWRIHTIGLASKEPKREKQFWEWELGDWKEFRLIRILAVDRGEVSFLDISLPSNSGQQKKFQTTILITYPIDSRSMNRIESSNHSLRNDINALVFSVQPILNVTAKVFDSSRAFRVVEEIPLQLSSNSGADKPLFHAKWNADSYMSASATRYWLQVFVLDSLGKETASTLRPFSVEGKMAHYSNTWLAYLVFNVQWEKLFSVLLWSNISSLFTLLSLPKLLHYFMEKNPSYQRWAMSVSISKPIQRRRILFYGFWFLIEGSRSRKLWFSMVIFLLYLLTLPWFWGHATSENGDIATMYMFGWKVQVPDSLITKERLGTPDIMTITLPFMYMVVTPSILLIYSLFAERSAACLRSSRITRCSDGPMSSRLEPEQRPQFVAEASTKSYRGTSTSFVYKVLGGWTRRIVLLVCLAVASIHLKLSSVLMEFYDIRAVTWSPAVACGPLFLLGAAIYSTITDS